jgi:hypothetical protein
MESWMMPTSYEPETFIIDSAPLSENISVFDNVGGTRSRLAAATTATQIVHDEYGMVYILFIHHFFHFVFSFRARS